MLAAVHGLLADEALQVFQQLRVLELILEMAGGLDEELLALREVDRERVEELGDVHALAMPVADALRRKGEMQVAAHRHGCGRGGGLV